MKRDMIKIDRDLCNGCGECIPNCHEGALQIVDEKAVLVSDLMCDGLGACIGHCPLGAISIEKREAEPYNETLVIKEMVKKGANTVIAHLKHLKDHNEKTYLTEGVAFLLENKNNLTLDINAIISEVHNHGRGTCDGGANSHSHSHSHEEGGCPSSKPKEIKRETNNVESIDAQSELTQWPVQLHLLNPTAGYFQNQDILLAADCVAFSLGNFHQKYLKGKKLAIACPKLDSNQDIYLDKLVSMINNSNINTLTVMVMEVACCNALLHMATKAVNLADRKIPLKVIVVSINGEIKEEKWV